MEWLLGLVCGLMCFGFLTEAQPKIRVYNPIMVALAGETLHLEFHVTVPVNQSSVQFVCHHRRHNKVPQSYDILETKKISWKLSVFNSSDSGEYYCKYQKTIASWEILVRDVGYRESVSRDDSAVLIPNVALNVGLFLFSSIGSIILLKDYRKQHKLRNERKEEGEGEGEMVNEVEDAVATDSVYTALEHGTSSIYNVLDPSANDMDQTCVQQTDNSQKEDGIFESVYENF